MHHVIECLPVQHLGIRAALPGTVVGHPVVWLVVGADSFTGAFPLDSEPFPPVQFNTFGQFAQGFTLVLALMPRLPAFGTEPSRQVRDAYPRLGLVLVLATRATRTKGVDSEVFAGVAG